ncbi:hypothetical protein AB0880_29015 [Micromonospora chersina]|uniref:hypothetical protein n=1 Tax=Micromonospora chersina TaxID=47854 RepID=UPI003456C3DA
MLVFTRAPTGEGILWRVGRQHMAWRPVPRAPWRAPGYRYPLTGLRGPETFDMLSALGALLATPLVWPWRAVTNRWPVVAYALDAPDGNIHLHRTPPMRRAQAKVVVRAWAEHIERYGEPPAQ